MFIRATAKKLLIAFSGCTLAMARLHMYVDGYMYVYANIDTHIQSIVCAVSGSVDS